MTKHFSHWLDITQKHIDSFANVTQDKSRIHTDPDWAETTKQGSTIAHGFYIISLFPHLTTKEMHKTWGVKVKGGYNYGLNKVRFLAPVPVNKRIRAVWEISKEERKQTKNGISYLLTIDVEIEIEGIDSPAVVGEWMLYYY